MFFSHMNHNQFLCYSFLFWQIIVRIKSHIQSTKFIKIASNSKHSRQKTQKMQEDETVVFQKNRCKMLTYINPFEQNHDHMRISHEIEFRSSFKEKLCFIIDVTICLDVKILRYLQSDKIWVAVLQNQYIFAKNYYLHGIGGKASIVCKYIIYIFFQFWEWLLVSFLCFFQKLQLLVVKIFSNNFCCIVLLFVWAHKVCLRFLKSYFKLKILILLSFLVSFLMNMFN